MRKSTPGHPKVGGSNPPPAIYFFYHLPGGEFLIKKVRHYNRALEKLDQNNPLEKA